MKIRSVLFLLLILACSIVVLAGFKIGHVQADTNDETYHTVYYFTDADPSLFPSKMSYYEDIISEANDIAYHGILNFVWWEMAFDILNILIFEHLGVIPMAMVLFVTERKRMQRMKWYQKLLFAITFPLFGIIGDAATWVASVTKVTWKPIPHGAQVKIEELEVQIA